MGNSPVGILLKDHLDRFEILDFPIWFLFLPTFLEVAIASRFTMIGQMLRVPSSELSQMRGIGQEHHELINMNLRAFGLHLDMDTSHWSPPNSRFPQFERTVKEILDMHVSQDTAYIRAMVVHFRGDKERTLQHLSMSTQTVSYIRDLVKHCNDCMFSKHEELIPAKSKQPELMKSSSVIGTSGPLLTSWNDTSKQSQATVEAIESSSRTINTTVELVDPGKRGIGEDPWENLRSVLHGLYGPLETFDVQSKSFSYPVRHQVPTFQPMVQRRRKKGEDTCEFRFIRPDRQKGESADRPCSPRDRGRMGADLAKEFLHFCRDHDMSQTPFWNNTDAQTPVSSYFTPFMPPNHPGHGNNDLVGHALYSNENLPPDMDWEQGRSDVDLHDSSPWMSPKMNPQSQSTETQTFVAGSGQNWLPHTSQRTLLGGAAANVNASHIWQTINSLSHQWNDRTGMNRGHQPSTHPNKFRGYVHQPNGFYDFAGRAPVGPNFMMDGERPLDFGRETFGSTVPVNANFQGPHRQGFLNNGFYSVQMNQFKASSIPQSMFPDMPMKNGLHLYNHFGNDVKEFKKENTDVKEFKKENTDVKEFKKENTQGEQPYEAARGSRECTGTARGTESVDGEETESVDGEGGNPSDLRETPYLKGKQEKKVVKVHTKPQTNNLTTIIKSLEEQSATILSQDKANEVEDTELNNCQLGFWNRLKGQEKDDGLESVELTKKEKEMVESFLENVTKVADKNQAWDAKMDGTLEEFDALTLREVENYCRFIVTMEETDVDDAEVSSEQEDGDSESEEYTGLTRCWAPFIDCGDELSSEELSSVASELSSVASCPCGDFPGLSHRQAFSLIEQS